MKIKFLVFSVLIFSLCYGCSKQEEVNDTRGEYIDDMEFSQQGTGVPGLRDWWYTLERGKLMFRQGDYGGALLAFDDARRQRRAAFERMERSFIEFLSLGEIRRLGDDLGWIEQYIHDRQFTVAADLLNDLYYHIPRENLKNSASAALAALGDLKDYPEAEYWIGETYYIQGELTLALKQFQKARDLRHLLETPDFATVILYKIADIHRTQREYNEMEWELLSILNNDTLWAGSATDVPNSPPPEDYQIQSPEQQARSAFTVQAMTRTLEGNDNGINRFINQYRYGNNESVRAHNLLGEYHYNNRRYSRAQRHLMFAFLIQNTIIIDELTRRRFDFTVAAADGRRRDLTMEVIADEINRDRMLSRYAEENEYFKTAYFLGNCLYATGKITPARELWNFLAGQEQAGEWQGRALSQLRSPRVERGVEMP